MKLKSAFMTAAAALALNGVASAAVLTTGDGDGTVDVDVTAEGTFGSSTGGGNAIFDPEGAGGVGTVFESGIAIGNGSGRTFLTDDIEGAGGASGASFSSTSDTMAVSTFVFGQLAFTLTQTIAPLFDMGVQTGSQLIQTYDITNTGNSAAEFEIIRYLDGDLGSFSDDGGGLIVGGDGSLTLFETDTATGTDDSTVFVSISTEGGVVPTTGAFEVDNYDDLAADIVAGATLDDMVLGDGIDADTFIDAGSGFDVVLALANYFNIAAGDSATYITTTVWGSGAPRDFVPDVPIPAPLALFATGLAGLGFAGRRKRAA